MLKCIIFCMVVGQCTIVGVPKWEGKCGRGLHKKSTRIVLSEKTSSFFFTLLFERQLF